MMEETRKAWHPVSGVIKVPASDVDTFGRIKGVNQKGDLFYAGPAIGEKGFNKPKPVI